jgi:L-threonylcarbamoyladenylate synthase
MIKYTMKIQNPPTLRVSSLEKGGLKEVVDVLKDGGLVVFPSDTVYILAVDPTNGMAVEKLLAFKNRWTGKAISIAVLDKKMAKEYVELNENGENIYTNLLPGPFTIVSKGKAKVVKEIEAENGTLGIRIPDNKYILDLIKLFGKPITATSANLSRRTPNYSIASFLKTLSNKKKEMIDLIVDAGKLPKNKPSTVIDATESELKILRRGDLITGGSQTLISKSEKETEKIAEFLLKKFIDEVETPYMASLQKKPLIFALTGDLGCGKTVFSRKIGHLLGIKEKITSPTFVIYNEYSISPNPSLTRGGQNINKFLHFDLYRINTDYELEEIKFFELFKKNIACIEWPENMGKKNFERLKKENKVVTIQFKYLDEKTREIKY